MKILAIDPSLTNSGLAYADQSTGTLSAPKGLAGIPRLVHLRNAFTKLFLDYKPDVVVLEDYAFASKSAHVHATGEFGGMLRLLMHDLGVPHCFVSPASLKLWCAGKGNAKKEVVMSELSSRTGRSFRTSDEADAWGLASLVYAYIGKPWVKMPQTHQRAWDKVAWPEVIKQAKTVAALAN